MPVSMFSAAMDTGGIKFGPTFCFTAKAMASPSNSVSWSFFPLTTSAWNILYCIEL